jgi:hypothetical protein
MLQQVLCQPPRRPLHPPAWESRWTNMSALTPLGHPDRLHEDGQPAETCATKWHWPQDVGEADNHENLCHSMRTYQETQIHQVKHFHTLQPPINSCQRGPAASMDTSMSFSYSSWCQLTYHTTHSTFGAGPYCLRGTKFTFTYCMLSPWGQHRPK